MEMKNGKIIGDFFEQIGTYCTIYIWFIFISEAVFITGLIFIVENEEKTYFLKGINSELWHVQVRNI